MHAFAPIISAFALAGVAHGFVAALYSDPDCVTQIGERNVYDNTCATLDEGIQSWMVTTQGGGGQYGRSFINSNCASTNPSSCRGVQGPDGTLNVCINLGAGYTSNALGSSAVSC